MIEEFQAAIAPFRRPNSPENRPQIRVRQEGDMTGYRCIYLPHIFKVHRMDELDFQNLVETIFERGSTTGELTLAFLRFIERPIHIDYCTMEDVIHLAPLILRIFINKYAPDGMVGFIFSVRKRIGLIPFNICQDCNPLWPQWRSIATASYMLLNIRIALGEDSQFYRYLQQPSIFESNFVNSWMEIPFEIISFDFTPTFPLWHEHWRVGIYHGDFSTWIENQVERLRNNLRATTGKIWARMTKIQRLHEKIRNHERRIKKYSRRARASAANINHLLDLLDFYLD